MQAFFTKNLLHWHKHSNHRQLPWKGETNAYKIWLSEIILQQTRSEQGLPYYNKFITQYPTITHLANANDNEVFKLWEGLGYYNRCRNLLFTARFIRDNYKGVFPNNYNEIIALKGVGSYTAAAIASFAYQLPYAVLDGNVYRILARYFNIELAIDVAVNKKIFEQLANELLSKKQPAAFNQAIMDFGATVCTPKNAKCNICVLQKKCKAYELDVVDSLPIKSKKIQRQARNFYFFILEYNNQIAITQRAETDIWRNLHQFYTIEIDDAISQEISKVAIAKMLKNILPKINSFSVKNSSIVYKQVLTHRDVFAQFIHLNCHQLPILPTPYFWINKTAIGHFAFPKIMVDYCKNNLV